MTKLEECISQAVVDSICLLAAFGFTAMERNASNRYLLIVVDTMQYFTNT